MTTTLETKYRFNKERHLHQIEVDGEWKNLTGCTTVLSVLAKPALIPWAAKMATEYIRENIEKYDIKDKEQFEQLLSEAKSAHAKRKTDAGAYGTQLHELAETYIKGLIEKCDGYADRAKYLPATDKGIKSLQNFMEWAVKNKVRFLESEKNVYSEFLFTGGIVDFVCEIDGEVWIGDIKTTGSGIYPEHFFQCAGYDLMLGEMGLYQDVAGYLILNLKENGEMLEKRSVSNEENRKIFMNCLEIYRMQEKLKNQII